MPRFYGAVGYGTTVEVSPGVHEDVITERYLYGDVEQNMRQADTGDTVLPAVRVQNTISLIADAYALEHFFLIRYIRWQGVRWTVHSLTVQRPRLLARLGEVYHGPTPAAPVDP